MTCALLMQNLYSNMINSNLKLNPDLFDQSKLESKPTRDGFGHGLVDAAKANSNIVGLTADLSESTRMEWFQKEFPDRFIEIGVAEQNLVTVASGMANVGKNVSGSLWCPN